MEFIVEDDEILFINSYWKKKKNKTVIADKENYFVNQEWDRK